jgi:RNA polymerase sigma-70 factor, ECF subfamily
VSPLGTRGGLLPEVSSVARKKRNFTAVQRGVEAAADSAINRRVAGRDPAAFWILVEPYDQGLRALAFRILENRDLMDDAPQEAYLKAYRALPSFRGDAGMGSWLYRIVYNACMDSSPRIEQSRQAPLEAAGESPDPGPGPAEVATSRHDLTRALASLTPDMRAVVLLVDAEGLDYRQTAEILGVAKGTVASRLNRARALLRWGPGRNGRSESAMARAMKRDEILGTALRKLDVPVHGPEFHTTLRTLVEREAAGRSDLVSAPSRGRFHRVLPRRGAPTPRRGRQRAYGLAAAAGITAAAVVAVSLSLPGGHPQVASAAEVRATVGQAWASARNIGGELVVHDPRVYGTGERRWSFVLTAHGDVRLADLTRGGVVAYDAARDVERSLSPSESIQGSNALFPSERSGLAPGLPDPASSADLLDRNLGSAVRALAAGGGGTVREISYGGRPAWLLDTDIRPNLLAPTLSPNHLEVTVDRETGFPVRVVATNDDPVVYETRIENSAACIPTGGTSGGGQTS